MPFIKLAGVTSKPGFITFTPSAHTDFPFMCVTSSWLLSSIGISAPVSIEVSIVESGAAI